MTEAEPAKVTSAQAIQGQHFNELLINNPAKAAALQRIASIVVNAKPVERPVIPPRAGLVSKPARDQQQPGARAPRAAAVDPSGTGGAGGKGQPPKTPATPPPSGRKPRPVSNLPAASYRSSLIKLRRR